MSTVRDLGELARRLASLAEDPHPRLATWCLAFERAETALREALVARHGQAPTEQPSIPPPFSS